MKLYMKQKVFSWADKFYIRDESGQYRYYIEGEIFTFGKKLHLYDQNGMERAFIWQKILSFLPRFYVEMDGMEVAEIQKEFTFFSPHYRVNGPGWEVEGDFWGHDYVIADKQGVVATVHKVWMSWGDSYEIDISDTQDEVMTLAIVLAIDAVMDAQASSSCSASQG